MWCWRKTICDSRNQGSSNYRRPCAAGDVIASYRRPCAGGDITDGYRRPCVGGAISDSYPHADAFSAGSPAGLSRRNRRHIRITRLTRSTRCFRPDEPGGERAIADLSFFVAVSCGLRRRKVGGRRSSARNQDSFNYRRPCAGGDLIDSYSRPCAGGDIIDSYPQR
jgi:hypothetical protein